MKSHYKAIIYCEEEIISYKQGDDVEELYLWMLTQANGHPGSVHGQVIEEKTETVIRQFRKTPVE